MAPAQVAFPSSREGTRIKDIIIDYSVSMTTSEENDIYAGVSETSLAPRVGSKDITRTKKLKVLNQEYGETTFWELVVEPNTPLSL